MTSTPSWRRAEEKKPPSALESALWGLPGLAWHAHSGLVNFTGSVAGTVVSGFRAVVTPAPAGAAVASQGSGVLPNQRPHELYGEDDEDLFQDGQDDGLFTPVHAYDDSLELVVWDDSTLYTPPLPDVGGGWEEDSPVMSQLQQEVADLLGRPPPTPSPNHQHTPPPDPNKAKQKPRDPSLSVQEHAVPPLPGAAVALGTVPSVEIEGNKKRGAALVLGKLAKAGTLSVQVVLACAAAVVRGPKQRLLQLAHVLGVMLRAMIASTALFGTSVSTLLRRLVSPRAKNLPRPDVFQRLTTTFTRFLHGNYPWLLAHPIFYGRPFPWQWKGWKPQPPPSSSVSQSSGSSVPGLPSLSALLRDVGEAVTPQGLMQKRQARRERREQQRNGGDEAPPWRLPLHVKDDWSKSILQLDHDGRHRVLLSAPPAPPQQLDVVSPVDFAAFVPPSELKGKEEKMLEKEVKKVQQQHLLQEEAKLRQEEAAATQAPSASPATTVPPVDTAPTPQQPNKGPDLFTSYFPHELEEGQEASSPPPHHHPTAAAAASRLHHHRRAFLHPAPRHQGPAHHLLLGLGKDCLGLLHHRPQPHRQLQGGHARPGQPQGNRQEGGGTGRSPGRPRLCVRADPCRPDHPAHDGHRGRRGDSPTRLGLRDALGGHGPELGTNGQAHGHARRRIGPDRAVQDAALAVH